MNKIQKQQLVEEMTDSFQGSQCFIVTRYHGLTVSEITSLRRQARALGVSFKVAKNKLLARAVEGTDLAQLNEYFTGPTAISYSKDAISAAKAVVEYAKGNEKLIIVAGVVGDKLIDENLIRNLASLPSIEELRAKIVGVISASATKLVRTISTPATNLTRVLKQSDEKKQ